MKRLSLAFCLLLAACGGGNAATNNQAGNEPASNAPAERSEKIDYAAADSAIESALDEIAEKVEESWKDYYRNADVRLAGAQWDEAMTSCRRNADAIRKKLSEKVAADQQGFREFAHKRADLPSTELRRLLVARLVEGETIATPDGDVEFK